MQYRAKPAKTALIKAVSSPIPQIEPIADYIAPDPSPKSTQETCRRCCYPVGDNRQVFRTRRLFFAYI